MADVARPGMGQDEKDRIGQAEMTRRRIEAGELVADRDLDGLNKDQLVKQASLRGVQVDAGATKPQILRAIRGESESVVATEAKAESEEES